MIEIKNNKGKILVELQDKDQFIKYIKNQNGFDDINFSYLNVEEQFIKDIYFKDCSFKGSEIINCVFDNCVFDNCVFDDSMITKTNFRGCSFNICSINDASFKNNDFKKCRFNNGIYTNTDFSHSNMESCLLAVQYNNCILNFVSFRFSDLRNSSFKDCKFLYCCGDGNYINSFTLHPYHIVIIHAPNFNKDGSEDLVCVGSMQLNFKEYTNSIRETKGARLCDKGNQDYETGLNIATLINNYLLSKF